MGERNIIRLITAPQRQRHCHGRGKHYKVDHHSTIPELERSIRVGPVDFAASLGGIFGLCLGFSIISFLEIIYWTLARLARKSIGKVWRLWQFGSFCSRALLLQFWIQLNKFLKTSICDFLPCFRSVLYVTICTITHMSPLHCMCSGLWSEARSII